VTARWSQYGKTCETSPKNHWHAYKLTTEDTEGTEILLIFLCDLCVLCGKKKHIVVYPTVSLVCNLMREKILYPLGTAFSNSPMTGNKSS